MNFASCQWNPYAKSFLQKMYPSKPVNDDEIPKLIDLINKDVLRIQDPEYHKPCQIIAGNKYQGEEHDSLIAEAIAELKRVFH